MQIGPGLGVAIMMNNYFHDVATALMIGTGFALHAIVSIQAKMSEPAATLFFLRVHAKMVKLFRFALWWIIIGGVPRTIFYTSFEWNHFADKMQIPALIVKHILMGAAVVWGIFAWRSMQRKVALLRDTLPPDMKAALQE